MEEGSLLLAEEAGDNLQQAGNERPDAVYSQMRQRKCFPNWRICVMIKERVGRFFNCIAEVIAWKAYGMM